MKVFKGMILFAILIFVFVCGKSPREKIVGTWKEATQGQYIIFDPDSSFVSSEESGKWNITSKAPYKLTYDDKDEKILVTFINDDLMEWECENYKIKLTRVKPLEKQEEYFPISSKATWK